MASELLTMSYYGDAFLNAEQLFLSAYALPNPMPELLNLIQAHPTSDAVSDLLFYYTNAVEDNPSRAHALALAVVGLRDSPEAPTIHGYNLADLFSRKLAELHSDGFEDDSGLLGPTNIYLITSLLSGLSFKYRLTSCPAQYENIKLGLSYPRRNSSPSEVLVTGACIQLLTGGSGIYPLAERYIQSAKEVAAKLKAQKSLHLVRDPNALKLLDLAIQHAETGFKKENDIDNVWVLLFPSA